MPERPYHWGNQSIVGILERQEYTGCTCNFKTYSKSYKLKKRIPNEPENMFYLPDTQEAMYLRHSLTGAGTEENKRRPAKAERQGLFSGLLFCADCGGKLHFATSKNFEGKQDHYRCSKYKSGRGECSAHYIRKMYCGNWYRNGFRRSMRISAAMWRAFRRSGCITAAPIRNETSGKIRSAWSRQ